ncbi:hypothetical protein AVEN_192495-1 [Araneus ventricosus]|uniref:Secreted protein n=1 Tax=Araneus ventricosus TaxID=182803 RepID=A0A4Y2MXJ3_ARAVE|nr:hypothetical protein AVEN_192495-1 [Araneus ventricosus]
MLFMVLVHLVRVQDSLDGGLCVYRCLVYGPVDRLLLYKLHVSYFKGSRSYSPIHGPYFEGTSSAFFGAAMQTCVGLEYVASAYAPGTGTQRFAH